MGARRLTAMLALGMAGLAGQTTAATVTVSVTNHAALSAEELGLAQAQASLTFEAIGVSLRWQPEHPDTYSSSAEGFTIRLLLLSGDAANRMLAVQDINEEVLGLAVSPARVAYVFCNRILSAVESRGMNFVGVLGRVIAHELGHVLLPSLTRHSEVGIMDGSLEVRFDRRRYFTAAQGTLIRELLRETPAPPRRCPMLGIHGDRRSGL